MGTPLQLALFSCLLLGLRHGFDYDHLAAITDITSLQRNWRTGMRLGFLYALGHACTIAVFGILVIGLHLSVPHGLDAIGERLVGLTLIVLGLYVLVALWRSRHQLARAATHTHRPQQSRIALLVSGTQGLWWRLRRLGRPGLPRPVPFAFQYDRGSVFLVGVLHGIGAETPSQLLLFLLAANLGGTSRGFLGLLAFIVGLLLMNSLMTASASGLFLSSRLRPRVQAAVTSLTAAYSLAVGCIFFFGLGDRLPALLH